jgi:cardiolipin synthase
VLGLVTSIHALMTVRTRRASIAWIVSLNTLPLAAVPAYWVLGRSRFQGYVIERRARTLETDPAAREIVRRLEPLVPEFARSPGAALAGQRLARMPYLGGNEVELLIDGEATFASLLRGIDRARQYVLVQFYIVHDDRIGRVLAEHLIARARAGVRVRFLYDEIGSHDLGHPYLEALTRGESRSRRSAPHAAAGTASSSTSAIIARSWWWTATRPGSAATTSATSTSGAIRRSAPGATRTYASRVRRRSAAALLPRGLALGDRRAARRAAALGARIPRRERRPHPAERPADRLETASLMFQQAIQSARERIWIASPYFIPDDAVLGALHLAALRGADVRILIPDHSDSALVDAAARTFLAPLLDSGIKVYAYEGGFLHSKHCLIDQLVAAVGTANLDNRSLRLNFEVAAIVVDQEFAARVTAMFESDLSCSRLITRAELEPPHLRATNVLARRAAPRARALEAHHGVTTCPRLGSSSAPGSGRRGRGGASYR